MELTWFLISFQALRLVQIAPPMKTHTDCITSRQLIKIPGLIDTHVHVREPGATHKEDYASCTAAALAGGVTMICAMPNTNPAVVNEETLEEVRMFAKKGARCDYALFVGASNDNAANICELAPLAAGLKMYLNDTYSTLKLNGLIVWQKHLTNWPKKAPLCVHAERESLAAIIMLASLCNRAVHVCHVARKEEILLIKAAKEKGLKVTCEVCPHHLFLSTDDVERIGPYKSEVRPKLVTPEDQQALWENMHLIDCFATDHAPHTLKEKTSANAPPGFPGLETIVPLLLTAVNEGRLTMEDIINKFHKNPRRIFNLPEQYNTYVEVDLDEEWIIPEETKYSKAKWTPFAGRKVRGSIHRVVIRGEVAYVEGQVLVPPGYGQNVREWESKKSIYSITLDSRPSSAMDGLLSPVPKIEYDNDGVTNEIFSKLLSTSTEKVHFAPEPQIQDPRLSLGAVSPIPSAIPPRTRTESASYQPGEITYSLHPAPAHGLTSKHILSVDMFSKEQLNDIFNLAQSFRTSVAKERPLDHILNGKIMASIFYEVSTRTSCSFAAAMQRLGGRIIYMDETSSSVKKGETLEDSVAVMAGYADVVVLRHPAPGSVMVRLKSD